MKVEISLLFCGDICISCMQFAWYLLSVLGMFWLSFVSGFFVCFVVCLGYSKKPLWLVSQFQSGFECREAIRSGREHAQLNQRKAATF